MRFSLTISKADRYRWETEGAPGAPFPEARAQSQERPRRAKHETAHEVAGEQIVAASMMAPLDRHSSAGNRHNGKPRPGFCLPS
jgi:hypothetical protein